MHYDFVEIGTSDFDTLISKADQDTIGLSVEPLQFYLDNLPDKDKVKKVCCAISNTGISTIPMYYIPPEVIEANSLPDYLRGCNSIGKMHNKHYPLQDFIKTKQVDVLSFRALAEKYSISSIGILKIDCEGLDLDIIEAVLDANDICDYPSKISFECYVSNVDKPPYCSKKSFDDMSRRLITIGYSSPVKRRNSYEVRL